MNTMICDRRLAEVKSSLVSLCHESGILTMENVEELFHHDLIEAGIVDSLGIVCLQDQIATHYNVEISQEHFVAELHTLEKLARFLAVNSQAQVPA